MLPANYRRAAGALNREIPDCGACVRHARRQRLAAIYGN